MGVFSYVPGERGVPAGGAGEYPALLLVGADHYGGGGCVWIFSGGYRKGEWLYLRAVLWEFGDRAGDGVCGGNGDQPLSAD